MDSDLGLGLKVNQLHFYPIEGGWPILSAFLQHYSYVEYQLGYVKKWISIEIDNFLHSKR